MKRILSAGLAALLVSCNLTESVKSTKASGPRIAPRLETASGVTLPVTDSVHVKVWSTSPAAVWYEKTLGWGAKFVTISGVPAGTSFLLSMEGRAKQPDGSQAVWWTGTQSGTASEPQTVDAQILTVPVTVRDAKAPVITALVPDTLLDSAVAGVRLRWRVTDDSLSTVTLNGKSLTPSSNIVTDSVTVAVGGTVKAILKALDKVGNLSLDTIVVSRKSAGSAVVTGGIPWNESIHYDTLTDSRDGQKYRTVVIGSQTWMAQNLNYAGTKSDTGVCYNNSADSCAKYGRLYTWNEAMAGRSSSSAVPSGVQGVCPTGWHLPSDGEWDTLVNWVGAQSGWSQATAGKALKSNGGWATESNNGQDPFGFRTLPSGIKEWNGNTFRDAGKTTGAWSSSQTNTGSAYDRSIFDDGIYNPRNGELKNYGFSLRCVKDAANAAAQQAVPSGSFGFTGTNPVFEFSHYAAYLTLLS